MDCVVLAAGEGKRMRPLTTKRPKVMLPLANRPMLEHLVLAAREAGITSFIFVVGYGEREIRRYFGDGASWGVNISYAPQRLADGNRRCAEICQGPGIREVPRNERGYDRDEFGYYRPYTMRFTLHEHQFYRSSIGLWRCNY